MVPTWTYNVQAASIAAHHEKFYLLKDYHGQSETRGGEFVRIRTHLSVCCRKFPAWAVRTRTSEKRAKVTFMPSYDTR